MNCPDCKIKAECINSRHRVSGYVHRRYKCPQCGSRFSTKEIMDIEEKGLDWALEQLKDVSKIIKKLK